MQARLRLAVSMFAIVIFAVLAADQDWSQYMPPGMEMPPGMGMPGGAASPGASPAAPVARAWEPAWIGGRVTAGGSPLSGVRIWAMPDESGGAGLGSGDAVAENAPNGNYALGVTAGAWKLVFSRDGYKTIERQVTVAARQDKLDVNVEMTVSRARLGVEVVRDGGEPLRRAMVIVMPAPREDDAGEMRIYATTKTDSRGWSRSTLDPGRYLPLVMHQRYWIRSASAVTVPANSEATTKVIMAPKNSRLPGTVVDDATGAPIPAAAVVASQEMDMMAMAMSGADIDMNAMILGMTKGGNGRTNREGAFTVRSGPGRFRLMAMARGYAMVGSGPVVEVAEGGTATRVVIRMRRSSGTPISGETDALTVSAGKPVQDGRHVLVPNVVLHYRDVSEAVEESEYRVLRGDGRPDTSLRHLAELELEQGQPLDGHWTVTDHTALSGRTYTYVIEAVAGNERRRSNAVVIEVP